MPETKGKGHPFIELPSCLGLLATISARLFMKQPDPSSYNSSQFMSSVLIYTTYQPLILVFNIQIFSISEGSFVSPKKIQTTAVFSHLWHKEYTAGKYFGELGMLTARPRAAWIMAKTYCVLSAPRSQCVHARWRPCHVY